MGFFPLFYMKSISYLIFAFLLYSFNIFYPPIAFFANLFIPLFFVLYLIKEDHLISEKNKILLLILSFFILAVYNYKISFNLFIMSAVPALFLYYRYVNPKLKLEPVIFAPIPAFLVTVVILLFASEIRVSFYNYILANLNMVIDSLKNISDSEIDIGKMVKHKNELALTVLYIIPSVSYVYISFMTLIAKRVITMISGVPLEPFRVPFHMVWFLILGGFTFLSNNLEVKMISYNTFIIFTYLYFIQGSNLLTIIMIRKRLFWLRLIVLILILIHPYIIIAIAFIGLFDNWFNFAGPLDGNSKD